MARGVATTSYESQVPIQEGLRRIVPQVTPSQLGAGLEAVGGAAQDAFKEIETKDANAHLALAVPQAALQASKIMLDAKEQPKDVIDQAGGFTPYVMKQFGAFGQDALAAATSVNKSAQGAMTGHLAAIGAKLQSEAMEVDANARIQTRVDTAEQGLKTAAAAVQLNPNLLDSMGQQQIQAQAGLGIDEKSRQALGQRTFDQLHIAAANGVAEQDPATALNRLRDPNDSVFSHLDLAQRELTQNFAKGKLASNISDALIANYRSNGAVEGAKGLRALVANPNVPDDIKDKIYGEVQTGVGLWRDEQRQTHADAIIGLNDRIGSGKTTLSDRGLVLSLFKQGAYGAEETGNKLGDIDRQQLKKVDDTVDITNAYNAYRSGTAMDPHDEGAKNGTNQLFNQMTTSVPTGSQEWTNAAADISRKTGVTPQYAIDYARTQLVSSDNDKAASAADTLQRLQDANPRGIGFALDDKTKAMASNINKFVAGGATSADAVVRARKLDSLSSADEQRLKEAYSARVASGRTLADQAVPTLNRLIQEDDRYKDEGLLMTGYYAKSPYAPVAMQGEFEQLRQEYFKYTDGDIGQANQLAYQDLKQKWGITEVNGKRELMQFAPESMNPGLTTDYLRDDMVKSAKEAFDAQQPNAEYVAKFAPEMKGKYFTPDGKESKPWEKVRLVPDPEATMHSQGQLWSLAVPNLAGFYEPLLSKTGRPLIYQLPTAAASKEASYAASMDKARADIAAEKARQKDLLEEVQTAAEQGGGW